MSSQKGDCFLRLSNKLAASMTLTQFENGYWYANQLKEFATEIGIPSAHKLRKDELERMTRVFLETGRIESPTQRGLPTVSEKDSEHGLSLSRPVLVYTNDKKTKDFLEREAQKLVPGLKRRSGARYRLNRFREEQLMKGVKLNYGDLVTEYIRFNQAKEPFAQISHGRYINFMSDFLAAERGGTWKQALLAWKKLKKLDMPKNYSSWVRFQNSRRK